MGRTGEPTGGGQNQPVRASGRPPLTPAAGLPRRAKVGSPGDPSNAPMEIGNSVPPRGALAGKSGFEFGPHAFNLLFDLLGKAGQTEGLTREYIGKGTGKAQGESTAAEVAGGSLVRTPSPPLLHPSCIPLPQPPPPSSLERTGKPWKQRGERRDRCARTTSDILAPIAHPAQKRVHRTRAPQRAVWNSTRAQSAPRATLNARSNVRKRGGALRKSGASVRKKPPWPQEPAHIVLVCVCVSDPVVLGLT